MGWSSIHTINIYDHTRDGEGALSLLATYQKDLSQRHYIPDLVIDDQRQSRQENVSLPLGEPVVVHPHEETVWLHDAETLAWIKKMQQPKGVAQ